MPITGEAGLLVLNLLTITYGKSIGKHPFN